MVAWRRTVRQVGGQPRLVYVTSDAACRGWSIHRLPAAKSAVHFVFQPQLGGEVVGKPKSRLRDAKAFVERQATVTLELDEVLLAPPPSDTIGQVVSRVAASCRSEPSPEPFRQLRPQVPDLELLARVREGLKRL